MWQKHKIVTLAFLSASLFIFSSQAALAGSAVLTWDANSESDLAGYNIYYDTVSRASGTCPADYPNTVDAGNVTTYTVTGLTEGQTYYFQITAYDTSDNESDCSTGPGEQSVTVTAPTITNISSNKANGTYGIGEVIDIDVTFSEAVTSTGNVTVTLETGAIDRPCTFTVSAATTASCDYTVRLGDASLDLTASSISGTIRDGGMNEMTNFVPVTNLAANKALVISTPAILPSTVGVFRNGRIFLKNSNATGVADLSFFLGAAGDLPIAGDWDGDGIDTVGVYRNGRFFLKNSNDTGVSDVDFFLGNSTDIPIAGDWNGDGTDTVGVYRNGRIFLKNANTTGVADLSFFLGAAGDLPIAGDWNGDGTDTVGVYRNGRIFLKNANTTGVADLSFFLGVAGDLPIAGDWNNDGIDTVGVYRNGRFFIKNANTTGVVDASFNLGTAGDKPVAGLWDLIP